MSVVDHDEAARQVQVRALEIIRGVFWAVMAMVVIGGYVAAALAAANAM